MAFLFCASGLKNCIYFYFSITQKRYCSKIGLIEAMLPSLRCLSLSSTNKVLGFKDTKVKGPFTLSDNFYVVRNGFYWPQWKCTTWLLVSGLNSNICNYATHFWRYKDFISLSWSVNGPRHQKYFIDVYLLHCVSQKPIFTAVSLFWTRP